MISGLEIREALHENSGWKDFPKKELYIEEARKRRRSSIEKSLEIQMLIGGL